MKFLTVMSFLGCTIVTIGMPTQDQTETALQQAEVEVRDGLSEEKLLNDELDGQAVSARSFPTTFITAMFIRTSVTIVTALVSVLLQFFGPYLGPAAVINPDNIIRMFDASEYLLRVYYL